MHSRAERRLPIERVARWGAMGLLAVAIWRAFASGLASAPAVHVRAEDVADAVARDSLAALRRAGWRVTWEGSLAPLVAMAEPVREPDGGVRLAVVGAGRAAVGDALGVLDSLDAGGGTLVAAAVRGALRVADGGTTARITTGAPAAPARVLVLGRAGWEAKYTIAALEERGWVVDARLRVAPGVDVTQGATAPSLARHAAVVVLDTAVAGDAAAIGRFVRAGGGLVLAGAGAAAPSLRDLAPARVARLEPPESRGFAGAHHPTHALALHTLGNARVDAIALEDRDGLPAVAARRVGAGRVLQVGYAETWRWRMQGEGRAVEEHRAFWSRLVGAVAHVPIDAREPRDIAGEDPAPLALTVQALGAPSEEPIGARGGGVALPRWLAAILLALLVAEWASRRTRGAS